ncbi:condensation domain-containing protein [Streptosporangium sp. NPDC006007]|uniref:condensation domain-containing protein n=1 Tax=Streptosporangium sp. NPDC006007 TaxID=3154575 RepID=UPI0033AF50C4
MTADGQGVASLIGRLVAAGTNLTAEGADLVYDGPASSLNDDVLDALRAHKRDVLAMLHANRSRGVAALAATTREQQRMELRSRMDRNPATYNTCIRVDLRGPVCPDRLGRAITALHERHEAFRTRFVWYGEHLLQEVHAPSRSVLQVMTRDVLAGASDDDIQRWCARRGAAGFDLATQPPARWCYAPVEQDHAVLVVGLHHIVCDGWSVDIMISELVDLYRRTAADDRVGGPVAVAATPRDFAAWERGRLVPERVEQVRLFWAEELRGTALSPVLTRAVGGRCVGGDADCLIRVVPSAVAAGIEALANSRAVTEFSLYFAAFAMLLSEEARRSDLAVVIAVANRTQPAHETVVGLCRNAVPIRCSVRDGNTIDRVAGDISERVARALEQQTFPIGIIAGDGSELSRDADLRRLPFTFGFEPVDYTPIECGPLNARLRDVYLGAARAEFSLLVRRRGERLEAFFEYATPALSRDDVAVMAARYIDILTDAGDKHDHSR